MGVISTTLFFIVGIALGSFFVDAGLRVPKKEPIIMRPSTSGKSTTKKGQLYPSMQIVTGLLFALAYYIIGFNVELLVALLFISLLAIITVSDITYMIIPNKVLLPFAIALFVARLFSPLTPWWDSVLGAVVGFGVLFIIAIISKGGMGGGDVKLFFVIGLVLGTMNTLLTLFLAVVIGIVVGIIILKKSGNGRKTPIPFGQSIAIAAVIAYFWGVDIVDWYWNLVG